MPSTNSLVASLSRAYPDITFRVGSSARWSDASHTISYTAKTTAAELLHELGHALLGHYEYTRDIELLEMERDAWHHAQLLSEEYAVTIDDQVVDDHLDTYRDWLHARSTCPDCTSNGIQTDSRHYRCFECLTTWRVNDARQCALRRYVVK